MERRPSGCLLLGVGLGLVIQQHLHKAELATLGGQVQGGLPAQVFGLQVKGSLRACHEEERQQVRTGARPFANDVKERVLIAVPHPPKDRQPVLRHVADEQSQEVLVTHELWVEQHVVIGLILQHLGNQLLHPPLRHEVRDSLLRPRLQLPQGLYEDFDAFALGRLPEVHGLQGLELFLGEVRVLALLRDPLHLGPGGGSQLRRRAGPRIRQAFRRGRAPASS
mmetsp:Transcript_19403/g.45904  ORF Transcript_19403/g.45904 Transcript_19403/m.45904 type:complete len:223 (-) Transcript_19403:8-676(-)